MEVVQNTNEFLSIAGKFSQPIENDLFGESVEKDIKTLSSYKKILAKMKIQQILHEIRWATEINFILPQRLAANFVSI